MSQPNAPAWKATGAAPRIEVINGNPVRGHVVTFTTAAGHMGEVFVPDSVGLDAARPLIAARVEYVDGLASMTG